MRLRHVALVAVSVFAVAAAAHAQASPSRFEVSLYPSARLMTTQGSSADQPAFHNYTPGGSLTMRLNDYFSVEGEVAGGRAQLNAPAMTAIGGDLIVNATPRARVRPYAAVGVGSIHMFEKASLGMTHGETFDTANVGGGVTIFFHNWGVRADYRFVGMDSTAAERSTFVGPGTRFAHRIYAGIVLAPGRYNP